MTVTANDVMGLLRKSGLITVDTGSLIADIPLTEQGLDSLDLMTVYLEIEETYRITVPDQIYEELRTADEIAAYLNEQLAP